MNKIEVLSEKTTFRSRPVKYISGDWEQVKDYIPYFELDDFSILEGQANPYYKTVVRLPLTPLETKIPVGIVSNTYKLVQHRDVADFCLKGLQACGINTNQVRWQIGLTNLGEWMNLQVYLPNEFDFVPFDEYEIKPRLECINSVDGSSRLVVFFSWFRLVCANGMTISETVPVLRDLHNQYLDLREIESQIIESFAQIKSNKKTMSIWQGRSIGDYLLTNWVDKEVMQQWGKLAACKVYHICTSGHDVEYENPFQKAEPSKKLVTKLEPIPGQPTKAQNLFDVSQALSWVATQKKNAEERTKWQRSIPRLLEKLITSYKS